MLLGVVHFPLVSVVVHVLITTNYSSVLDVAISTLIVGVAFAVSFMLTHSNAQLQRFHARGEVYVFLLPCAAMWGVASAAQMHLCVLLVDSGVSWTALVFPALTVLFSVGSTVALSALALDILHPSLLRALIRTMGVWLNGMCLCVFAMHIDVLIVLRCAVQHTTRTCCLLCAHWYHWACSCGVLS